MGVDSVVEGLQSWRTGAQYVAHDNLLAASGVTIAADSESGDFTADLVATWITGDQKWKATGAASPNFITADLGSGQAVTCYGIHGHNLGTVGAQVKLQYSDTGTGGPWTDWQAAVAPGDDSTLLRVDSSETHRYWRLHISGASAAPVIAHLFLGVVLQMPGGPRFPFSPPQHRRASRILNHRSEGGSFIGRSVIRRGMRGQIDLRHATPAWTRSQWESFKDSVELHPFYWAWNYSSYPTEVAFCYTPDAESMSASQHANPAHMQDNFEVIAL